MAGLETRPRQRITLSMSLWAVSRLYWAVITSCPSARSAGMSLLKHEPSAQMPWQKTMLGLLWGDMASSFLLESVDSDSILTHAIRFRLSHPTDPRSGLAAVW